MMEEIEVEIAVEVIFSTEIEPSASTEQEQDAQLLEIAKDRFGDLGDVVKAELV